MIQPLRRMHRGMFFALLFILPVLFVSGLLSRPKGPPYALRALVDSAAGLKTVSHQTATLGIMKFQVWIRQSTADNSGWDLQLVTEKALVAPDVLVYWSESDAHAGLPAGAVLLGTFGYAKHYSLTAQEKEHGFIVLYSLAQRQKLGSFAIATGEGKP